MPRPSGVQEAIGDLFETEFMRKENLKSGIPVEAFEQVEIISAVSNEGDILVTAKVTPTNASDFVLDNVMQLCKTSAQESGRAANLLKSLPQGGL